MSSASSTSPPGTARPTDGTQPSRAYTPGLSDGLGDRLMMFDNATQSSVELLRFKREFSDAPGFDEAVRARVDELSRFTHPSVASVRGVQMLDDGLALVSNNTAGRRLSEMVHVARGAPFAMDLIQQLAPALAALHQQGPRIAHGLLTAERIIITREGRLIVVEHVLASAFESLRIPATRLRSEFGIAVPAGTDPVGLNQRSDVVQLGFVALSLLLGRRLDPAHYPANMTTLLDEFTQTDRASAARLRPWLERALQQNDRPFTTAQEAQAAFGQPHGTVVQSQPAPLQSAPPPAPMPVATSSPAPAAAHQVLAFRAPAEAETTAPIKLRVESQNDIQRPEPRHEAAEPPTSAKIRVEPKADAFESKRVIDAHIAPAASSLASPRSSGSMRAVKWIAAVVVLTGLAVGGLYYAGAFADISLEPTSSASVPPQNPSPASRTTPSDVAPLNAPPVSTPPATEPAAAPTSTSPNTPASSSASNPGATPPPFGLSNRDASTATPPAGSGTPTTTGTTPNTLNATNAPTSAVKPAAGAAGAALGALGTKPDGTPADRPAPTPGAFGGVKVTSAIELQVFENGTQVGSTAGSIAVQEGTHTFELVNESLGFRVRSTVNVRGGQMTPLAIALPNGRLSINAVPWADVTIDGRPAGQTPLANVMVQIGSHTVVFRHPELGEQSQTVVVKADGITRVSATFKQ